MGWMGQAGTRAAPLVSPRLRLGVFCRRAALQQDEKVDGGDTFLLWRQNEDYTIERDGARRERKVDTFSRLGENEKCKHGAHDFSHGDDDDITTTITVKVQQRFACPALADGRRIDYHLGVNENGKGASANFPSFH